MGQSAAETVKEIEEIRERMDGDFAELQDRLPAPAVWGKRLLGIAIGGGVAGTALLFGLKKLRGGKKKKRKAEGFPAQAVIQVLPEGVAERVSEKLDDEKVKQIALGVGGAWLLFKLAELRQLRKLQRAALR